MGMCSGIKLQIRRVVQASFGGSKPSRIEAFFPDSYGTQRQKRGWCTSKLRIFTSYSCLYVFPSLLLFPFFHFFPCFCVGTCKSPPSCFNWLLSLHVRGPAGIVTNPPATIRPDPFSGGCRKAFQIRSSRIVPHCSSDCSDAIFTVSQSKVHLLQMCWIITCKNKWSECICVFDKKCKDFNGRWTERNTKKQNSLVKPYSWGIQGPLFSNMRLSVFAETLSPW